MEELLKELAQGYTVHGTQLKDLGTNRKVGNLEPLVNKLSLRHEDLSRKAIESAIQKFITDTIEERKTSAAKFDAKETPEDFIDHVFKKNSFKCDNTGDKFHIESDDNLPTDRATVETVLIKEMYEYNHSIPINEHGKPAARSFIKDELLVQLDFYIRSLKLQNVMEIRDNLKFDSSIDIDEILKRMLRMMHSVGEEETNLTVLKHFLWTIKRHIYGRPVKLELWLAIFGGQNIGKNYFVENVLAPPLQGHTVDTELSSIADIGREIGKFQNRFLINFDELAKGAGQSEDSTDKLSSSAVAQLKAILTRKELTIRQMGGQNQMILPKNFSCMSTANVHIYDVIDDPTGMRRFFEIKLDHPDNTWFDREDMEFLIQNCENLYKGIDESLTEGYLLPSTEVWTKVREIQSGYKAKSSIDFWMEDGAYELGEGELVTCSDLYDDYKMCCKESGLLSFGKIKFIDGLGRRFEIVKPGNKKSVKARLRGV